MSVVIVCGGTAHYFRRVFRCPTCKQRRRFVCAQPTSLWYTPTHTCLGCGDSFSDGRLPRPMVRGWRAKAIAEAKQKWAQAISAAEQRVWIAVELAAFVAEREAADA